jgi:hypothetical protein
MKMMKARVLVHRNIGYTVRVEVYKTHKQIGTSVMLGLGLGLLEIEGEAQWAKDTLREQVVSTKQVASNYCCLCWFLCLFLRI